MSQLHPHGGRQPETHGAKPTGVDPAARLVKQVILGCEHLVLSHIGCDKGVAAGGPIQRLDNVLRLDNIAATGFIAGLGINTVTVAPFIDLLPPVCHRFIIQPLATVLQLINHFPQHHIAGTDNRNIRLDGFGDRCGIHIDMDDCCRGAELAGCVGYPIIKTSTDGQNHIGVMHCRIGFKSAVHTEHANKLGI